jgi:hypothetical protein
MLTIKKVVFIFSLMLSMLSHAGGALDLLGEVSLKVDTIIKTDLPNIYNLISQMTNNNIQKNIGENYRGGTIFWLDETKNHGLIVSLSDIANSTSWRNGDSGSKTTNAKSDGVYAGESNTRLIISEQTIDHQKGAFAALLASEYKVLSDGITPCGTDVNTNNVCYGNWYLPSIYELALLRHNLPSILKEETYWSSTEASVKNAFLLHMASGEKKEVDKSVSAHIRAISQF